MTIKDWVTIGISVVSLIISFSTWIDRWISQKKNIEIKIYTYEVTSTNLNYLHLYCGITNKSQLPISITRIQLQLENEDYFDCLMTTTKINEITRKIGKEVINRTEYYTLPFPISLPSLGAANGYISFEALPNNLVDYSKPLNFLVSTNRGKSIQMKLPLDESDCLGYNV